MCLTDKVWLALGSAPGKWCSTHLDVPGLVMEVPTLVLHLVLHPFLSAPVWLCVLVIRNYVFVPACLSPVMLDDREIVGNTPLDSK